MRRHEVMYWAFLLALVFAIGSVPEKARGVELLNGDLRIGGKLENYTGLRMQDREWIDPATGLVDAKLKKGRLERMRSTVQLETEWKMGPQLVFKTIGRADYEAKYSLDSDIFRSTNTDNLRSLPDGNNMESHAEMREFYVQYSPGNFTITAGRQQVVWGESDNLRMADIINPLDISWNGGLVSWEDIRIPQWMIDAKYSVPGSAYNLTGELVWNPFDFQPTRFAPYGDTFYVFGDLPNAPIFFPASTVNFRDAFFGAFEDGRWRGNGEKSLKNGAIGARIGAKIGSFQFYLEDYYAPTASPVVTFNPNPFDPRLGFRVEYPYQNTFGGSFNYDNNYLKTIFRGEFGYVTGQPFANQAGNAVQNLDTFSYMIGFDHTAINRFLNPTSSFFISGQFFQTYIMRNEETISTGFGKDGNSNHQALATLLINTAYWFDKIKPQIVYVQSLQWNTGLLNPEISYQPAYEWSFTLGYSYLWGKTYNEAPFSAFKDNDELYVKVTYKF